jgi:uncharacterized membrane protein YhaH (DUF805 family)
MFKKPFSFNGRIRRTEFGVSLIWFYGLIAILAKIPGAGGRSAGIAILVLLVPIFWFRFAQGAKRCHDMGHSGWFQLIPFYSLLMLFASGNAGANRFGDDPKTLATK